MPRPPQTSAATSSLSDRVYGALLDEAKRRPGPVHLLNVGDTYLEPLPAARAEAQLAAEHPRLHNYAPVQGEPALLDAIQERVERVHGVALERPNLQVMSGATGGFTVVATALLEPGDEVLLLSPFWPLIRGIVESRSARAVELPFYTRLGEPGFDAEALLESAITPRTVAVYVNTPNNPTGRVLAPEVADAIARVVTRRNLWLWCDEAYEELWYGATRPKALWARDDLGERAIACHTLSKSHALAGARIGYTHGPASVMPAIRGAQTFLTYCAPRPLQFGGARALAEGDAWVESTRRLYAETGRRAASALGLPPPEGGTFFFFDASRYFRAGEDIQAFLRRCLDAGVLLTPGAASGKDYESWARLCFTAIPPAELEDALGRLAPLLG
ncbi:MAG: pyridoxal phosphate-dependent aminotransferase [Polyangiaceae bacterium]|nr:pyridoxal phosphate-dependent aminotransferase [Polyangiaceae bacterium]MBK8996511.1 pyridoxal phosphate-dependent aminotransferase [Myxococcales bacterium]